MQPLRIRALEVQLAEAEAWAGAVVSDDRVATYLRGCEREGAPGLGSWLATQRGNGKRVAWCASARGWAESEAHQGERVPPWRAGARELKRDAQEGRRLGGWVPGVDAQEGRYVPPPGSLVIYWRGSPGSWQGHAETVVSATAEGYRSIGGNERGGRWWIDQDLVRYSHPRLLGFISEEDYDRDLDTMATYSAKPLTPPPDLYDEDDDAPPVPRLVQLEPDWTAIRESVRQTVGAM
jgi:hypothetical protein